MPLISCTFRRSRLPRAAALLRPFTLACLLFGGAWPAHALAEKAARGDHLYHHSGHRPERGG